MKVFVVNCGSSSIKYQLFDMSDESVLAKGLVERVGSADASLRHSTESGAVEKTITAADHTGGMAAVLAALVEGPGAVIDSVDEIKGVGHRVVHGGEEITDSRRIDDEVISVIRRNADLAPLHNPPNLMGIEAAMAAIPSVAHVAVFDTAFLSTLPAKAYRYAVPDEWYREHHVRRYGFHGTSHKYVTAQAAKLLGKSASEVNLITAHLGNGCSMTAVAGGKAVDHSMGMTPLEGLVMGTRSGSLDPAIVFHMIARGMSAAEVDNALNKKSGLLGVSGVSNDMRDLIAAATRGNESAELAMDLFVYSVVKYVGQYYTILPGVDAVVLTGGVGENSVPVRGKICQGLRRLGAAPDQARNEVTIRGKTGPITTDGSQLPVWIVPTNEELMIARDTCRLMG